MYINDLESFLEGLNSVSDESESHLNLYIKLFAILYADDTVLLPESAIKDLQKQLDSMSEYCNFWKLGVNIEKSKVMVFSRGQLPRVMIFLYNGKQLEIVKDFNYLGVVLTRTGNFKKMSSAYNIAKSFMYKLRCDSNSSDIDLKPST
jgi:hypothetical protein